MSKKKKSVSPKTSSRKPKASKQEETKVLARKAPKPVEAPEPAGKTVKCVKCGVVVLQIAGVYDGGGEYLCKKCYSGR